MSGLELLPLGVGDAFSATHYTVCLALRAEGRWLLVDCPHPLRKLMREGAASAGVVLDVPQLEAVVLTHLHADHCSGVEGYGLYCKYVLGGRAKLAAHPAVSARLWEAHLADGMASRGGEALRFEDFFDLVPLDEGDPVTIGPFRIACRRTRHVIPTTALRIEAAGRTVAYSADTEFDPELIRWLEPADLVLHETGPGIHTPLASLAALPEALRRRMRLVHYPDTLDPVTSPIEPLRQGQLRNV